jgi:TBCC domain-containing protein 1
MRNALTTAPLRSLPPAAHAPRTHLPTARQRAQEHLQHLDHLVQGFPAFMAKHATQLLGLLGGPEGGGGGASDGEDQQLQDVGAEAQAARGLTAAQFDRLGFLLQASQPAAPPRPADGDSPMDVCTPGPFAAGAAPRLSDSVPAFAAGGGAAACVPAGALAAWLRGALLAGGDAADGGGGSGGGGGGGDYVMGTSPPRPSVFNQLMASSPLLSSCTDVVGVHRATAARGEDDLRGGRVRVLDCADAVVYCLAPLQYATVAGCSDCVIVRGAVGRAVRVERCERVQVVAAAASVAVSTCHDCILYLGVNRPPALLGDNRFVQLAPHNAGYERLEEHMALAGVAAAPNAWADAVALLKDAAAPAAAPAAAAPSPSPMQTSQPPAAPGGSPSAAGAAASAAGGGGGGGPASSPVGVPAAGGGSPLRRSLSSSPVGSPAVGAGVAVSVAPEHPPATLLPPAKLMPLTVPFRGGAGPLCGGPARANAHPPPDAEDDMAGFMSMGDADGGGFAPSPFPLPPDYAAAWEARQRGAAGVRAAYRAAGLEEGRKREFMAAVQAHFKDWLQGSGGMREAYELARLEKEAAAGGGGGGGGGGRAAGGSQA